MVQFASDWVLIVFCEILPTNKLRGCELLVASTEQTLTLEQYKHSPTLCKLSLLTFIGHQ